MNKIGAKLGFKTKEKGLYKDETNRGHIYLTPKLVFNEKTISDEEKFYKKGKK